MEKTKQKKTWLLRVLLLEKLYIFVILQKNLEGRANLENNFVYFLRVWDTEMGVNPRFYFRWVSWRPFMFFFSLDLMVLMLQRGMRTHVNKCNIESRVILKWYSSTFLWILLEHFFGTSLIFFIFIFLSCIRHWACSVETERWTWCKQFSTINICLVSFYF